MLRQKTAPEVTCVRLTLAARLVGLRCELFGERGGGKMAKWLGVPARTWHSYEHGVVIPGPLILKIIVETSVEPVWLLRGTGPKFRRENPPMSEMSCQPATTVSSLLRLVLTRLEPEHSIESNSPDALAIDGICTDSVGG
jgi:hypothetical protein